MTVAELSGTFGISPRHTRALLILAGISPSGWRGTGHAGHPSRIYDSAAAHAAYAEEAQRTSRPFANSDWIASALLGRRLIRADAAEGALWNLDDTRAEHLGNGGYGWIRIGPVPVAAHRIIWIAADGEIPPVMQINHINRLRWDNRRANLELTSPGNNMRHRHGTPYLTYHDAVSELAELASAQPALDPYGGYHAGGMLRPGTRSRRPGH